MLLERATEFEVTIARTFAGLESLAPEWHELWKNDPCATPFQSPTWLIPWARHFTAGEFCCVCVRVEEQLVGFLPMFEWRNPDTSERELLLLGTGLSDYCDGLFLPGYANESLAVASEHLSAVFDWDLLNFQDLRSESPLALNFDRGPQSIVPILELPPSVEELNTAIPKAQLQNLAYYRRRAERLGLCEWQAADSESLGSMLEELFDLNSVRWRERGAVDNDDLRGFHRDAASRLLRINALRLYRLRIAGETAAVLYGFASHGRTYYYLGGFNQKFASVSPGTLIIGHAIEQAVREGGTHFDFLRGAEHYKYLWGAKDTQTFRVRACRQHLAGAF